MQKDENSHLEDLDQYLLNSVALRSQREIAHLFLDGSNKECCVIPVFPDGDCGFTSISDVLRITGDKAKAEQISRGKFISTVISISGANKELLALLNQMFAVDGVGDYDLEKCSIKFSSPGYWAQEVHFKVMSRLYNLKFEFYCLDNLDGSATAFSPFPLFSNVNHCYDESTANLVRLAAVSTVLNTGQAATNHFDGILVEPTLAQKTEVSKMLQEVEKLTIIGFESNKEAIMKKKGATTDDYAFRMDGMLETLPIVPKPQRNTEKNPVYFPRCEYYTRFKGTTYFDMNEPEYWRTYFRSTSRGGGCDRYSKKYGSYKKASNEVINKKCDSKHAKSGAFLSPFFHDEYKGIVTQTPESKEFEMYEHNFLYDNILKYKQNLCEALITKIGELCSDRVIAIYANKYPCVMISLVGISKEAGKKNIDSWYKMVMSYYLALVNDIARKKGMPIELVLRSSFAHNIPSVDSTEESFRINIGIIPYKYVDILSEGLKLLSDVVMPELEKSTIPIKVLETMNSMIVSYNTREGKALPSWRENLFETLNLQAVKGGKKTECVNIIHEIIARNRAYPDLLVDIVMQELLKDEVDYANPLIRMLEMLNYSGKSLTLNNKYGYPYSGQNNKLDFGKIIQAIDDNEFWKLLEQISKALGNKRILSEQIKCKRVGSIYSILEEANLGFIRSSYQITEDGVGSDSDCEADVHAGYDISHIYSRKITVATGMRAINIAAFLVFQDIIYTGRYSYRIDTNHMYYETKEAIDNASDVMAELFDVEKKRSNARETEKILFFDLNECNAQNKKKEVKLEDCIEGIGAGFPVILDYTSATTDKIRESILICLKKTQTILLVNSGLKNEQMGADINPYGTLRIISTDHKKLLELYTLAKSALFVGGSNDYLPKIAHQIRKSYKEAGFTITIKELYKSGYEVVVKQHKYNTAKKQDKKQDIYYWDFVRHAEEIKFLRDSNNGFTSTKLTLCE